MKAIKSSEFKEKCLNILDNLDPQGLVITKHGKPVARIYPIKQNLMKFKGCLKGKIKITGDIFSTGLIWDAES